MGFFGSKDKNKKNISSAEIQEKVEREVIVHNMPSQEKIVGEIVNENVGSLIGLKDGVNNSSSGLSSQVNTKKDFKLMGFLIIFIGLIFIALIIFLTYRFVIAPTASLKETKINTGETQNETISDEEVKTETEIIDSSIDINQEASDLDSGVTEALEEDESDIPDDLMQEEFQGQDAVNLSPLIDSDSDSLYDEEEVLLGTSIFLSDSDGDGYDDLSEIRNNYNPGGIGFLVDSPSVSTYRNLNHDFNFLYPSAWEAKEIGDNLVVLEDKDNSLIQLATMDNAEKLSILNWYQTTFPEDALVYDKLISKSGYEGVISKSGLNVYLTNEARTTIFVFSYIPVSSGRLALINIFEMIYSSLVFPNNLID